MFTSAQMTRVGPEMSKKAHGNFPHLCLFRTVNVAKSKLVKWRFYISGTLTFSLIKKTLVTP